MQLWEMNGATLAAQVTLPNREPHGRPSSDIRSPGVTAGKACPAAQPLALAGYRSPAYTEAGALRAGAVDIDIIVIEGHDGPQRTD